MGAKQAELKRRLLRLLEGDLEFRYAVAGYLGMSEVLKHLGRIGEDHSRLREDFNRRFEAHEAELRALGRVLKLLREDFNRMQGTIHGLLERVGLMNGRLARVERTLEKLTLDIEEEGRSIVAQGLR